MFRMTVDKRIFMDFRIKFIKNHMFRLTQLYIVLIRKALFEFNRWVSRKKSIVRRGPIKTLRPHEEFGAPCMMRREVTSENPIIMFQGKFDVTHQ